MDNYPTALVLGLGSSGCAAARMLLKEGTAVTVVDASDGPQLRSKAASLEQAGATVLLGCEVLPERRFAVCVVSPGVACDSDWLTDAAGRGTEVIGELELAWRRCRCRTLALTGSNGKTTAVALCRDALASAGYRAQVAGNSSVPLSAVIPRHRALDWIVVEVSSYQLEQVDRFRPAVGVLLNLSPNHLDRHRDMATYAALKARMFRRMTPDDTGITSPQLAGVVASTAERANRWVTFADDENADSVFHDGKVTYREPQPGGNTDLPGVETVNLKDTIFDNEVLGVNAAACVAAVRACGVAGKHVGAAAKSFQALPHRMQEVATIRGVRFVDDSKATNTAAMCAGLKMAAGPVRLIAGGASKEKSVREAGNLLQQKVLRVYLIGRDAGVLASEWEGSVDCCDCGDLVTAVQTAWADAREGEVVLLSPACASFDQFRDFEERGEVFIKLAESLKEEAEE